jgi:hypothetical protein
MKNDFKLFTSPLLDSISLGFENVPDIEVNVELTKCFIQEVDRLLRDVKYINSRGYLNEPVNIPIIKDIILPLISEEEKKRETEVISVKRNELAYNYLILNLYIVGTLIYERIKDLASSEYDDDIIIDLKTLLTILEVKMPNNIKIHLRRQGIKIIQNIYNGFDTEYELRSSTLKLNELLSVQLACNVGMFIKLPYQKLDQLKYVHPQTSEVLPKYDASDEVLLKLELFIIKGIEVYRKLFLRESDNLILNLIEGLNTLNLPSTITEDSIIFSFDLSEVVNMIKITSIYSSDNLINDANSLVEDFIIENALKITDLINKFAGRLKDVESIKDKILKAFTKRTSRISYGYSEGKKLSITTVRNLYISCHVTGADLSILSDFESFKERLDIVNKCFTTRGLPLIEIKYPFKEGKSEV